MDTQSISVSQPENLPVTTADFESNLQISAIIHFLLLFKEQRWVPVLKAKYIFVFSLTKDQNPISTIWTAALCICTLCRCGLRTQTAKILLWQQAVARILIQKSFEVKRGWIRPSLCFCIIKSLNLLCQFIHAIIA